MNVLIDTDIIIDICTKRQPYFTKSDTAYTLAKDNGYRIWIYTGSLQTLYFEIVSEIKKSTINLGKQIPLSKIKKQARESLRSLSQSINWLAALSEDGDVFSDSNPIICQLVKAFGRLGENALLITRNDELLKKNEKAISTENFISKFKSKELRSIPFIDLAAQQDLLRDGLERKIHNVLHHGQYILGPEIRELEKELTRYVGVKHAITCSSGTDALLMPLMAFGIGPGDAVFTTPFTFIATAEVISLLGATPVFVDIDSRTFNLDPEKLREAIHRVKKDTNLRPRGVIPVDLFGLPAEYDIIMSIAEESQLFVLEDAAQGFGGVYKQRKAGSLAHVATTSFFPAKPLGAYGDGGAIFTDDDGLAEKLISLRVHGKGSHKYENVRIGLNGRFDTLQAALLIPKLGLFPEELKKRQQVAEKYTQNIKNTSLKLQCPFIPSHLKSAWAQYSILADRRNFIQEELKKERIPTVVYYPTPLHLQPAFSNLGYAEGDFPVSEMVSRRIFSLPMSPYLQEEQSKIIIEVLNNL